MILTPHTGKHAATHLLPVTLRDYTFAYWRHKYKREHSEAFTEITPDSSSKNSIELIFPSGVKMMVSRADVGFIRSLVQ